MTAPAPAANAPTVHSGDAVTRRAHAARDKPWGFARSDFRRSNVYLALKIGLTVSASIPIAVLSITIFRWLGAPRSSENNIVQTTGSAADSVSAGVVFTIPAILLMGYDLDIGRVTVLAIAGGLMGVLI